MALLILVGGTTGIALHLRDRETIRIGLEFERTAAAAADALERSLRGAGASTVGVRGAQAEWPASRFPRLDALVEDARRRLDLRGVHIRVVDTGALSEDDLWTWPPARRLARDRLVWERPLDAGGRPWAILVTADDEFFAHRRDVRPWLLIIGGVSLATCLGVLIPARIRRQSGAAPTAARAAPYGPQGRA
jgi:CHASE1-domain containing sensor protein